MWFCRTCLPHHQNNSLWSNSQINLWFNSTSNSWYNNWFSRISNDCRSKDRTPNNLSQKQWKYQKLKKDFLTIFNPFKFQDFHCFWDCWRLLLHKEIRLVALLGILLEVQDHKIVKFRWRDNEIILVIRQYL